MIVLILMIGFVYSINRKIKNTGTSPCSQESVRQAALVLGARVYANGNMSPIFRDRVDTAIAEYKAGRADKILVSGDHGRPEYDEVNAAKNYLLEQGIPPEDIFLDHAGFDTYDSLIRARDVFGVKTLSIVTQDFHLPRALYIADALGLDACGVSADKQEYAGEQRRELRESLARIKAWFNVLVSSKPKYGGEAIPIEGDGQKSWD